MVKKPPRRRFRFGLRTLIALIALSVVAVIIWNLFAKDEPSWNNLDQVKPGMTIGEVQALVGEPSQILQNANVQFHVYRREKIWFLVYLNDKFVRVEENPQK